MGAPAVGTFNFTGYLREREGIYFQMTYFSLDGTWDAREKAIRSRACLVPRM
jgi:hypothetical protein